MQTHINYQGLNDLLVQATNAGRNTLFEHEVYQFIQLIGGETPPQFHFLPKDERLEVQTLQALDRKSVV